MSRWESFLSKGLQLFMRRQKPENVEFVVHPNGWSIRVKTDEEKIEEAREFWENHVEDKI